MRPKAPMHETDAPPTNPPPHWGEDKLTEFMQLATMAAWGAFMQPNTRPLVEKLMTIDATFLAAIEALNGPTPNFFEGLMLVSAHSAFRSAAQFAMEGRTCEAMVLLRSCLEYAVYAVHFHRKPELSEVWAHRGDGANERKAVRKAFVMKEMLDGVIALSNEVGERCRILYELTIDMGAHPNELGFFGRLNIQDVPGSQDKRFEIKYLQGGDIAHLSALTTVCRASVCTLECFWLIYRIRYDLLEVSPKIEAIKIGL